MTTLNMSYSFNTLEELTDSMERIISMLVMLLVYYYIRMKIWVKGLLLGWLLDKDICQSNLEKLSRHKYVCKYQYQDYVYKIPLTIQRGPTNIVSVIDTIHNQDVTDQVKPYLDPNGNCHGLSLTAQDIGYIKLCILTHDGQMHTFEKNQIIRVV